MQTFINAALSITQILIFETFICEAFNLRLVSSVLF